MSTYLAIRATSTSDPAQKQERAGVMSALRTLLAECGALVINAEHAENFDTLEVDVSQTAAVKLGIVETALSPTERPAEELTVEGTEETKEST